MKSMLQKVMQLQGLIDTSDVTEWENRFLKSINTQLEGENTIALSSKQVEVLDRIWSKHFA
jgi:hypothetical protein